MSTTETTSTLQKVSVLTLTGMVVGSMVGGGVFTLPRQFGEATGVLGALIAWVIAGTGMLMLALVFQSLAMRRPDLDSGIYIYAQEGFGSYSGFNAAFGYWASNVAGNVFFMVFTMTTLGDFFPGLGEGNTLLAVALASAGVWLFHFLIANGVRQAAVINRIVTVAKLIPILVFIVIVAFAFDAGTFGDNFWGGDVAFDRLAVRPGQGHHARHDIRVPRSRGGERLLAAGDPSPGCRQGHGARLRQRARTVRLGDDGVVRRPAAAGSRQGEAAVDGRGARVGRRIVGRRLHQHRGDRLGPRRLPGVDAHQRRGPLHARAHPGDAGVPEPREQEQHADRGPHLDDRRRAAAAALGARRQRCARLHAEARHGAVTDPVPSRRELRGQADDHARDLRRRRRLGAAQTERHRLGRRRLCALPAVLGGARVPAPRLHRLRTGNPALPRRPARAGQARSSTRPRRSPARCWSPRQSSVSC